MIEAVLNTGSTVRQGAVIKGGRKMTDEYVTEAAYCCLNPADMARLGSPAKVKVHTDAGEVTVYARIDEGISEGQVFIPRGPWANTIVSCDTQGSGSPYYKGMNAWVE
ncbi:formylmethanofuran dehydrogenase [ANME-1 cluster archaeon GoMg4]|nr:formylmethanofuran dehydrogenase [ANME-1 cluster archaeon GoMg4]